MRNIFHREASKWTQMKLSNVTAAPPPYTVGLRSEYQHKRSNRVQVSEIKLVQTVNGCKRDAERS